MSGEIWFESAGARLYAAKHGSGLPVVFLHGGLADHRAAAPFVAALEGCALVITPDMRGAGRSHDPGPLTWEQLADDVVALLDDLQIERAVVGGTSMGSGAALAFALRHMQRTRALVLVAPVYAGRARGLNEAQQRAFVRMNEAGQRALAVGMDSLVPMFEALPLPIRARAVAMVRSFDPVSVAATTHFLASGAQPFDDVTALSALTVPCLVVPGSDSEHPEELADLYAEALPSCTLASGGVDPTSAIRAFLLSLET